MKLPELNHEQQRWIGYFLNMDDIIDVQGKLKQKSMELDDKLIDIFFLINCLKYLLCDINKFEKQHVISIKTQVEKQVNKSLSDQRF